MAELLSHRDAVAGDALVELRLDGVVDVDVDRALEGRTMPTIVTCRPEWEGGRYRGPETDRIGWLNRAIEAGAEYVDVEWRAERSAVRDGGRLVLSFHDMAGMPLELGEIVTAMCAIEAAVVKVAITAARLEDCVALREATGAGPARRVVIAMGPAGIVTRVCPWLFGSWWTYAGSAAPGQLSARALREDYRVGESSPDTRLFGVVGSWEGATALAAAHNSEFRRRGVDAVSIPLAAADARDLDCARIAFAIAGIADAPQARQATGLASQAARDIDRWMTA